MKSARRQGFARRILAACLATTVAMPLAVAAPPIAPGSADPGETGTQATSEAAYTSYARVGKARNSSSDFTVTGNSVTNATEILFPTATGGGPEVLTHWSIGEDASGAGVILYKGALSSSITVNTNSAPRVAVSGLTITED